MAWGGGVFTRTYGSTAWQTDASNSVGIVPDRHDTNDQDLADGINACINKAGGNTPTADLPMGGYKHTNLSAGSAAAPTFCAGNDQDTGMYSPAANQIGIATNGVDRVRIDASGNVGIGTATPTQALDVVGALRMTTVTTDATTKTTRFIGRSFTNSNADWLVIDGQGRNGENAVVIGGGSAVLNSATVLQFITAPNVTTTFGTEQMRITSGGLVGIGTTNPLTRCQITGAGSIGAPTDAGDKNATLRLAALAGDVNAGGALEFGFGANTFAQSYFAAIKGLGTNGANNSAGDLAFYTRNSVSDSSLTERIRINSGGNVGVGIASPGSKFTVGGSTPTTTSNATNPGTIQLNESGITNFTTNGGLEFKGSSSGSGYGSKLLGLDNGSLVFLYRNNSATWTESARLDNSGFFSARGSKDRTTAVAANCHIDSTDGAIYRSTSSIKYKTDVADYTKGLEELKTLRPVTYKGINNGDITFAGLIAEEVHDAGFSEFVMYNSEHEPEGLAYGNMIALAVKAIKELSDKLDTLTARVEALEA